MQHTAQIVEPVFGSVASSSRRCARLPRWCRAVSRGRLFPGTDDHAGGRRVRVHFTGFIADRAFGNDQVAACIDHFAFREDRHVEGQGTAHLDVQVRRAVAFAGRQDRVRGAARDRVEHGGGETAVHAAHGIRVVFIRRGREDDSAVLDRVCIHGHGLGNAGPGEQALRERLHQLQAGHVFRVHG